ncbi:plasmid mobilization protein [Bryobacter aggregatus]|uniref:plasmid mobilization protein n=1 Tax=Bryobacter aggregatus TaxID=360054 RepID=UPI0012BAC544|nr:hypothetical protein [Bryobacter aggregatus]
MPVYRPRTRLVNFRLSEDEYERLKDTCFRSGARSVSDYARAAVLAGAVEPSHENRWQELEISVRKLEDQLGRLMEKELVSAHG